MTNKSQISGVIHKNIVTVTYLSSNYLVDDYFLSGAREMHQTRCVLLRFHVVETCFSSTFHQPTLHTKLITAINVLTVELCPSVRLSDSCFVTKN